MRRSGLSLVTAAISLVCALIWLAIGEIVSGLVWVAISIGWVLASAWQWRDSSATEPAPARRLLRRFSRMILFWS